MNLEKKKYKYTVYTYEAISYYISQKYSSHSYFKVGNKFFKI